MDDVNPGDGGLVVVPGSHKANFHRPHELFNLDDFGNGTQPAIVNVTPKAGDVVIMPELLTHGILPWTPKDRMRRILILRYAPQHKGGGDFPAEIKARLSPETRELIETAHYTHVKEIVKEGRAAA